MADFSLVTLNGTDYIKPNHRYATQWINTELCGPRVDDLIEVHPDYIDTITALIESEDMTVEEA